MIRRPRRFERPDYWILAVVGILCLIGVLMVVGFKERVDLRTLRKIGERCASAAAELSRRLGAPQRGQRVERPA